MTTIETTWNEEEFKAYLMIYGANSNFIETEKEREMILNKVDSDIYRKMRDIFDADNDYQRIQKIMFCVDKFGYTTAELDALKREMKEVMAADGKLDELESNMFLALQHLI